MFLSHWATLVWVGLFALNFILSVAFDGLMFMYADSFSIIGSLIGDLAFILGPLVVFYFIDYTIYGKITWLPWEREKN